MKINSYNLINTKNNFIKFEQAQMHNSLVYNTDVFNAFKIPRKKWWYRISSVKGKFFIKIFL